MDFFDQHGGLSAQKDIYQYDDRFLYKKKRKCGEDDNIYNANQGSLEQIRYNYYKKLSLLQIINDNCLLEVLQMLNPIDICNCRMTGRFLNRFISNFFHKLRRVTQLDVTLNGKNKMITYKYRVGNFVLPVEKSHLITTIDDDLTSNIFENKSISRLKFHNVFFSLDNSVQIFLYLWHINSKVDELIVQDCQISQIDKKYRGSIAPRQYFFMILHQIAAKIIRFNRSDHVSSLSQYFLNNSSVHKTERIFFSNTLVIIELRNLRFSLVHFSLNNFTYEWRAGYRNHLYIPFGKHRLLYWLTYGLEGIRLLIPHDTYEGYINVPLEQQAEISKAIIDVSVQMHANKITLSPIKYE